MFNAAFPDLQPVLKLHLRDDEPTKRHSDDRTDFNVIVPLKVYGDESADATKSRVFAVAGIAGSDDESALASIAWLRRTRGKPFHANKCESEYAKTDRDKHDENLTLYKNLTCVLVESHLVGVAIALDLQSFHECLPDALPDVPYYKCFTDVVRTCADMARRFNTNPNETDRVRLEFVFDSRFESNGTAGTIYAHFCALPEWKNAAFLDANIAFERGSAEPRLEMPDLFARESMKELERQITRARPKPRASFTALEQATRDGTKKFIWVNYDRRYCERWRDKIHSLEYRGLMKRYARWLSDTKRIQNGHPHDTVSNRVTFYTWLENQEALGRKPIDDDERDTQ